MVMRRVCGAPAGADRLERIYGFLGLELRPAMREAVTRWIAVNRNGAHGVHRYTAEQFGLTAGGIRDEYDVYIKRFGVPIGA